MSTTNIRFAHGVASGDPYADSVILWTRISPADGFVGSQNVQWEIASSADFAPGSINGSGSFTTSSSRDWTVKVEAAGLRADTTYFYRFRAGDGVSSVGQTKTLPVGSDPVRLAVLSCSNFPAAQQFDAYTRAAAINSANPYDAWLQVGDYIYEYGPGGYGSAEDAAGSRGFLPNREILSLDDYRERYAQYHTDPGLQALRAAAPLIAIWDDHETANDSWKGGAENHQSATEGDWIARRDAALKAYYEWIPIREPGQRQLSDGASASSPLTQGYRSFSFGEVLALHMLETRLTARDEQLQYPDAAAVQARIGAILADPAQVASYATQAGIAPPTSAAAIPAFATALAPLVTQELVIATVQKAWGDPNRDLIGDTQMAWLQQQMASSSAAWQVLGQQVLMQSMAVPTELLLNAGNPALLDKYAGPLQKLATGTPFSSLPPAEQALFAEAGKIPYNLDAWDGYGAERETILQTALALGKRLISLAGDTHNAWAGVLDTMSAGSTPAGTVAGLEFATPGVTSPGLEKYLPGADAYIRANYPAVDGLDGLFLGYVNGLKYADLNRRGFLDLTVSKEQAVGSFQFLNGTDAVSGQPLWSSESVISSSSYGLSTTAEAQPLITWQPGWRELDLIFGLAFDAMADPTYLDPAAYASVPRDGVQLADVRVQGSPDADRVVVGIGATVEAGAGSDELDNTDSRGGNLLAGGMGTDRFLLRAAGDTVIGGDLLANAISLGLPDVVGQVDGERDVFLIDSSNPSPEGTVGILDFELGRDELLLDGLAPTGSWSTVRQLLQGLGITVNAAPQLGTPLITLSLQPGVEESRDLGSLASDPDGNPLQLVKLDGPAWITTSGTTVKATAPIGSSEEQLAAVTLRLAFSDGQAAVPLTVRLTLNKAPSALTLANIVSSLAENSSTASPIKVADIVITDDASGSNTISLSGADASSFEVSGNALFLKAGTALNFEAKASYAVTVSASDPSLPGSTPVTAAFSLTVSDLNEAPSALTLANTVSSLAENSSTARRIKVADIVITDDASGSNTFSLSGADASSFEVSGNALFLKAGTALNFEAKASYAVTVSVSDPSLSGSSAVSADFNLSISDVNEVPGTTVETVVVAIDLPTGESKQIPVTISGAALSLGSELKIVPVSGINQESFDKLIQSGVKLNSTAIDFVLDVAQGQKFATLASSSELVAADLLPQLGNGSGRLSSHKLLSYALNPDTGTISPLTFDPITGAGARFFDTNNDGAPDFFSLSLIDGGYGDKDGLGNGIIEDQSFTGFVELNNLSFSSQASGVLTVAQLGNSAPAAVSLRANLSGRSSSSNEIGYVVLAPDELPGSANLLNDFTWLRGRAKTLLSSLESTDVTLPANTRFERDILLINGQSLRFFEIQDASLDQLTNLSDSRFRYLNSADIGNNQASFSSSSGVRFSLDILPGDPGLNALIAQAQVQAPVLDLTALTASQGLQGTVALGREAELDSVVGFYRALDVQGTVVAADGVTRLRPGDLGYGGMALRSGNLVNQLGNLSVADDQIISRNFANVTGGSFLAPYALVNGNTFFAFSAASSDGISHFRSLGNNLFGLEDVFGGGDSDYDDMVIGLNFTSII
jgi:phosphodiesterase/alkaline phosphatase D-like protein